MSPRLKKVDIGSTYDPIANDWCRKIQDRRGYHFWAYGVFDAVIEPHADRASTILDIGCGTGTWLTDQSERDGDRLLVGIDASYKMARKARRRSGCSIVIGDAERQPFKDDVFDLVVSRGDAVTQAFKPTRAFSEVHRLLIPGGRFCFEMSWGNRPFEGHCREEGEILYRKDTKSISGVEILVMKRYHLPDELMNRAQEHLGDEQYQPARWPDRELAKATSVEERHILVGEEGNIRRALSEVGLVAEDILGTGALGWLISTNKILQNRVEKIAKDSDTAIETAAELAKHIDLAQSHRVTVIAMKP